VGDFDWALEQRDEDLDWIRERKRLYRQRHETFALQPGYDVEYIHVDQQQEPVTVITLPTSAPTHQQLYEALRQRAIASAVQRFTGSPRYAYEDVEQLEREVWAAMTIDPSRLFPGEVSPFPAPAMDEIKR
jgi:hypothetical protein